MIGVEIRVTTVLVMTMLLLTDNSRLTMDRRGRVDRYENVGDPVGCR